MKIGAKCRRGTVEGVDNSGDNVRQFLLINYHLIILIFIVILVKISKQQRTKT